MYMIHNIKYLHNVGNSQIPILVWQKSFNLPIPGRKNEQHEPRP